MKLLILGGTVFLGRHLVEAALARGHRVTLFNRGRHNPDLFPQVARLRGDRDGGLAALEGGRWDAAVDTCGSLPRVVRASAELLAGAVGHYTFISTLAVYAGFPATPGLDESCPVATLADPTIEEVGGRTYGPLKALCEQAAERALPSRVLVVRSGLLVGPHDPTERFAYWPRRVARGGEVLAPGDPGHRVQLVDARDLAAWILGMVEAGRPGVYNATGPAGPLTLGQVLETCAAVRGGGSTFTWVDERFLVEAGVAARMELPLWLPGGPGAATVDAGRALAAGLTFRPLAETIADTAVWDAARGPDVERRGGLRPEREAALLRAWHAGAPPPDGLEAGGTGAPRAMPGWPLAGRRA